MIRLEEKPFEVEGKRYLLRCNMAVLETVEDQHGDIEELMKLSIRQSSLELNDYAEEQGWEERWTPKQLKRKISYAMLMELNIVGMLVRALSPSQPEKNAEAGSPEPADLGN